MAVSLLLIASLLFIGCSSSQKASDQQLGIQLQKAMDESRQRSGATGVSAAIILPDGSMWKGVSGISHEGVPLTTEMLFDIASAAKNLQATLALKLVEDKVISLDDPIEKWFPPYPNIDGKITLRQILGLTSGIDNFVEDSNSPWRIGFENIDFEKRWTWDEVYSAFIGKPNFNPGERCAYSTTNYIILRLIIERATNSSQPTELRKRVLIPHQLSRTFSDFPNPLPDSIQIAHGWYDADGDGVPSDISGKSLNYAASLLPMLVYSTPTDMVRWIHALYHEKMVLTENSLKAMLTFTSPVQNEPMMKGYGLGVVDINIAAFNPRWKRVRAIGHLGSQFGYSTFLAYFPEYGVSIAMMFNRGADRATNGQVVPVFNALADVLFGYLRAPESKPEDDLAGMLDELKRSPNDVHLLFQVAKAYQAKKDDYEASLMYEQILKLDPQDKNGYKLESTFWKATYDGVIWKKPENLIAFISDHSDYKDIRRAYSWLAKTYVRRGEMDNAVQVYKNALNGLGEDAEFYNEFGWWVYENRVAKEYDTAIKYTAKALELNPNGHYIWDTLAWLYYEKGEYLKAEEASTKALKLAPKNQYDAYERSLKKIKQKVPPHN